MNDFNNRINDYLSARDTDLKKFLHGKKLDSKFSTSTFIDDTLFKCGVISAEVVAILDMKNKYHAYLNCSEDNIFLEQQGITELTNKPLDLKEAQILLANKVITSLDNVNYDNFRERIY